MNGAHGTLSPEVYILDPSLPGSSRCNQEGMFTCFSTLSTTFLKKEVEGKELTLCNLHSNTPGSKAIKVSLTLTKHGSNSLIWYSGSSTICPYLSLILLHRTLFLTYTRPLVAPIMPLPLLLSPRMALLTLSPHLTNPQLYLKSQTTFSMKPH